MALERFQEMFQTWCCMPSVNELAPSRILVVVLALLMLLLADMVLVVEAS